MQAIPLSFVGHTACLTAVAITAVCSSMGCATKAPALQETARNDLETRTSEGLQADQTYQDSGWAETAAVVVEGRIAVTVADPTAAVAEVRAIVGDLGGHITKEEVEADPLPSTVVARLPPNDVEDLMEAVAELGDERDRSVSRTDVSWEIRDTEIAVENLRRSMVRYEEMMHAATSVEEMLELEAELTRVRTEIDRLQGRHAFLQDRVALATMVIRLEKDRLQAEAQAKVWPGLRVSQLTLSTSGRRPGNYMGTGFSLHESRAFQLEADLFFSADDFESIEAGLITIGGGFYSALLGDGERRVLNPHMGWAIGYGWVDGSSNFVGMMSLGVELFRSGAVLVDSGVRFGLLAGGDGPSLALQPQLSVHLAF